MDMRTLARNGCTVGYLLAQGASVVRDQPIQAGVRVEVTISAAVPAEGNVQIEAIGHHRKEYITCKVRGAESVIRDALFFIWYNRQSLSRNDIRALAKTL